MTEEELEAIEALTRELRRVRAGELVARLSEAERQEIAARVADRLEPILRQRSAPTEEAPRRQERRRRRLAGG
jgi:hypothetical protein